MAGIIRCVLATVFVVGVALLRPESAAACSCMTPGSPCEAVWQARAVFVGRVVSISAARERRVELAVAEAFRGPRLAQVTVVTGFGDGDCGYPFEVGQSYLVYAHETREGQLETSICSRTRLLRDAREDLAYARSLAAIPPDALARLSGRVSLSNHPMPAGADSMAVSGVVVTATGAGRTFSATANERGEFELTGLPLGTYHVIARAPDGYEGVERTVEIQDPQGCGTTQLYVRVRRPRDRAGR